METKVCTKCKQELPFDNFRWKNKSQNLKHSQCKECQKVQEKQHYQNSKERQQSVKSTAVFQKERNIMLVEQAKKCGCKKCGEKRNYVLDFHHIVAEEKIWDIAHMIKSSGEKTLLEELAKCDVLCANCHREFHFLNQKENLLYKDWINS